MVRPANFGYNEETAANNAFQTLDNSISLDEIKDKARAEFDAFVDMLRHRAVNVVVADDSPVPIKPDAVFPNNWFSTSPSGTVNIFPMYAANRRAEKRKD